MKCIVCDGLGCEFCPSIRRVNKREARREIAERLQPDSRPSFLRKVARQTACWLSWPLFTHAYDAIFVPRPEKQFSYYEHCVCCGRARSWVSFGNNHKKPGSVLVRGNGSTRVWVES